MWFWLTIVLTVALGQAVKWWVISSGRFWVVNKGVAFSIGAEYGWLGWAAGFGLLVIGTWWLVSLKLNRPDTRNLPAQAGQILDTIAWGLLVGGGIGNLIDRLFYGGVVDYIQIGPPAGGLPVFNLADAGISVGISGVLFLVIYGRKRS